jgi:hypothetical protein
MANIEMVDGKVTQFRGDVRTTKKFILDLRGDHALVYRKDMRATVLTPGDTFTVDYSVALPDGNEIVALLEFEVTSSFSKEEAE